MDRIGSLPDSIIDKILGCLPLVDAVRTSILSKAWRGRWVSLLALVFDQAFFRQVFRNRRSLSVEYLNVVNITVLHHDGPLHEFSLFIPNIHLDDNLVICESVDRVLKKGAKKLSVNKAGFSPCVLSSQLFFSLQLTHLDLRCCWVDPPDSFGGLPNLRVLKLFLVSYRPMTDELNQSDSQTHGSKIMSSFISSCPQLEIVSLREFFNTSLTLHFHSPRLESLCIETKVTSLYIQETHRLKRLALLLDETDSHCVPMRMVDFFKCLPKLEHLSLANCVYQLLTKGGIPHVLSGSFDHLRKLELYNLCLNSIEELQFALCLIVSSSELCELQICATLKEGHDAELESEIDKYGSCKFEKLDSVEFTATVGTKTEIRMIDFLLRCSPSLKTMDIMFEEEMLACNIDDLQFSPASRQVKILFT